MMVPTWKKLRSIQAARLIKLKVPGTEWIILDARSIGAFSMEHLPGAMHLDPLHTFCSVQIQRLPKNARLLVYCKTHKRSGLLCQKLYQNGYRQIFQMEDGFTGWKSNRLSIND
jgi:rhodanese-related sulfurtransferase